MKHIVLLAGIAVVALAGCASSTPSTETTATKPTVAQKLATIQTQGDASVDDPLVKKFDARLDSLRRKCKDKRIRLADMIVRAKQLLDEGEQDESLISIASNVNASIPAEIGKMPCASLFAAYVTLRTKG